jgi:hypothetical protein
MWSVVPSFDAQLQALAVVFTQPSFQTHCQLLLGWLMCLGQHTEFRVFEAYHGRHVPRDARHPFDRLYNFFSRSAWLAADLAHAVALQVVLALNRTGALLVIVDATLLHKRGPSVWGLGFFYDPIASTKKRSVMMPGHKWVVLGLAFRIPTTKRYLCVPLQARLQLPGQGQPSEADLARQLLDEVASWFPDRQLLLVGDGAYSAKNLLRDLEPRVRYVGLMRKDAELYELPPAAPAGKKRGPPRKKGPRLPAPGQVAKEADQAPADSGRWHWTDIQVDAYGQQRRFQVVAFTALWPKVLGYRPLQVVVVRPLEEGFGEVYSFTTDVTASAAWVVETYARRTSIEAMFKNSKQVLDIQRPRHFCRQSIEKLGPWVWQMQSLVTLWYVTAGRALPEAKAARRDLGTWETEWSLRHMLRVLRRLTLRQAMAQKSQTTADLQKLLEQLESYLFLAT